MLTDGYQPEMNKRDTERKLHLFDVNDSKIQKVKVIKDESGHWYVLPNDLVNEFRKDAQNSNFVDCGDFDDKYGKYRTGGDPNLVQLYAII